MLEGHHRVHNILQHELEVCFGGWHLSQTQRFCSRVIPLYGTALLRRFHGLCLARSLPAVPSPLRASFVFSVGGLLAGLARRET